MPKFTQHAPGTFSWPELSTTDIASARKFYTTLFDWQVIEIPMGEMGTYHIFTRDGARVGAGYQLGPQMAGVPPHWAAYITVANADQATESAKAAGGELVMGPFDVEPGGQKLGRMSVLKDPAGAHFCVWQAIAHPGAELLGEAGSLVWTQLNSTDTAKAKAFYPKVVGWTVQDMPNPAGGEYTMWSIPGQPMAQAGMMAMPPGSPAPSHWLSYWGVADADASYAKALALGAKSCVPVTDIPGMGRFAVLMDPQDAVFAIWQGSM